MGIGLHNRYRYSTAGINTCSIILISIVSVVARTCMGERSSNKEGGLLLSEAKKANKTEQIAGFDLSSGIIVSYLPRAQGR